MYLMNLRDRGTYPSVSVIRCPVVLKCMRCHGLGTIVVAAA